LKRNSFKAAPRGHEGRRKIAGLLQRKIGGACRSDDPNGGSLGSIAGAR
jgi:hypothetical protein